MRRIQLVVLALLLAAGLGGPAASGPLLEDYLNYARLGEQALPGGEEVSSTTAAPLGQTFAVAPGTGEIYRVGILANPERDSWAEDEKVTLTVYTSPAKTQSLGSYTIDGLTNRTQGIQGREGDRVLLFPVRAKLDGQASLYLELTVSGGDGNVRFRRAAAPYEGGSGYIGGQPQPWDIAFETHIKPVVDRDALYKSLWDRFNWDHAPLAPVKAAVDAGDNAKAVAELAKHFHNRRDLFRAWENVMTPTINPNADTSMGDRIIAGYLYSEEYKENIPWRKESYWAPDFHKYGRDFTPPTYSWHLDRVLSSIYTETGDEKYAREAINLRMQWILDNSPSPRVTGIPPNHQIWNELIAGGRAPGHGNLPYARLYNYPGWTDEERLVYFLFWHDNAEFLYRSNVGGNWGVQTAENCRNFGIDFPEYKMSPQYIEWGSKRLVELTRYTVRGDGTQNEAAIKYHAMIARRLKSLLDDHDSGRAPLAEKDVPELRDLLERMYVWMAYTLQPNNYVAMVADSWYENYSQELLEVARKLGRQDLVWIATQGREGKMPEEISKGFPDGGYFHMRSDFGGPGKTFTDARQMIVHNGGWVGSHGHWDLLGLNMYAYGRTLLVDPGGMWEHPDGSPPDYWKSNVHNMLVVRDGDCSRDPGITRWAPSTWFDYLDGVHHGYRKWDVQEVRRRIVFLKPDYWVIDDSMSNPQNPYQIDLTWNMLGSSVDIHPETQAATTTLPLGGNVTVIPLANQEVEVHKRPYVAPMDGFVDTTIVQYRMMSSNPRFTTVVYPFKAEKPNLVVSRINPDATLSDLITGVRIQNGDAVDAVFWGETSLGEVSFSEGAHRVNADMAAVRTVGIRNIQSFHLYQGRRFVFNGIELVRSDDRIGLLDVKYSPGRVDVILREPDPSVVIYVGNARNIVVNGTALANPRPYQGYLRLFPDLPRAIIIDNQSSGFRTVQDTNEWEIIGDPNAFRLSYVRHETDPGRHEAAGYSVDLNQPGRFRIDVFIPKTTTPKTDVMNYTLSGISNWTMDVAKPGSGVLGFQQNTADGTVTVQVNQQIVDNQWVPLGTANLRAGRHEFLMAANGTEIDGLYPAFDAVRLTPVN